MNEISERFVDEDLASHWKVDETAASFKALLRHIGTNTNFRRYFEQSLEDPEIRQALESGVVADLGAGVGWTSAIVAGNRETVRVHMVEPSRARRCRAKTIANHFGVSPGKIVIHDGAFGTLKIDELVDLVILCASFHHCWDRDLPALFDSIHGLLKPTSTARVLITNEHYVSWRWQARRLISWAKLRAKGRPSFFYPGNLRAPDPFDGEHWRTRADVEKIFTDGGFDARIVEFPGDLCLDKTTWPERLGWHYYYAVLTPKRPKGDR